MLSELTIKNFAIIDDLTITFEEGLSVLTGETGAGKSMIISAVNLLLGSRASSDMVRAGCRSAELSACFTIAQGSWAWQVLEEQGLDPAEGLIVRRVIAAEGNSRVFINSSVSTIELLKKVTAGLAGISSQHAHQGLLKEENHLDILDEFAKAGALRREVSQIFGTLAPLKKQQEEMIRQREEKQKEQDFIAFQLQEIEEAAIVPDEDEDLEKKRRILMNAAKIFEAVNGAVHETYDREGSVIERLSDIIHSLGSLGDADERLQQVGERLSSIVFDLQDTVSELRHLSDTIDLDPGSLDILDSRLDLIAKLKRKYGPSLAQVFETGEQLQNALTHTRDLEKKIETSAREIKSLTHLISDKAEALSELRRTAAKKMSAAAQKELSALDMGKAQFDVVFSGRKTTDSSDIKSATGFKIGESGFDRVQFRLSPNPGEDLKPLAKIASGGELSRIVLALKAVVSKTQSVETLIFDEVDAGIGGATSEKVGQKLKQLSRSQQVICITHLAQIAKYGSRQFRIFKEVASGRTCTKIVPLTDNRDRVEEIARMIGGADISDTTLSHARELLEQADSAI